jgi:predicted dehydrogenase
VLTEARMSLNTAEACQMFAASQRYPHLVCQIVPSPFGLKGDRVMRELIDAGYLGELRQVQVMGLNGALADPAAPLSWRQNAELSGVNMLALGILHETLLRWTPPPVEVLAQTHAFTGERLDPEHGARRTVGTPDSVQVLAALRGGARAIYHLSGVTPFGQEQSISLLGSDGALHYILHNDRILGASRQSGANSATLEEMRAIAIPPEKEGGWRVEADFIESIREGKPVRYTDFASGVLYMEFTEAVVRSAAKGMRVGLPLAA